MTEKIASHPQNLGAMSHAMTAVFSSEVFMASMRRVMKTLLLDRDIQRILGVSFAGISKEAGTRTPKKKRAALCSVARTRAAMQTRRAMTTARVATPASLPASLQASLTPCSSGSAACRKRLIRSAGKRPLLPRAGD
jgi:hypothetical protein